MRSVSHSGKIPGCKCNFPGWKTTYCTALANVPAYIIKFAFLSVTNTSYKSLSFWTWTTYFWHIAEVSLSLFYRNPRYQKRWHQVLHSGYMDMTEPNLVCFFFKSKFWTMYGSKVKELGKTLYLLNMKELAVLKRKQSHS